MMALVSTSVLLGGMMAGSVSAYASSGKQVILRVVTWAPQSQLAPHIALFNKVYPDVKVEIYNVPAATDSAILTEVSALRAAGTPANMVWVPNIYSFVKSHLLVNLTSFIKHNPTLAKAPISKAAMQWGEFKGQNYMIPRDIVPFFVVVNTTLLAKYGMAMPKNNWTWTDFLNMAKKATDPVAGTWGVSSFFFVPWISYQAMGPDNGVSQQLNFLNQNQSKCLLYTPQAQSAVKSITDWNLVDHVVATGPAVSHFLSPGQGGFAEGRALFTINGTFQGPSLLAESKQAGFQWDVLPLPGGTKRQVGVVNETGIGILAGSSNQQAALDYLTFYYSPTYQHYMESIGNYFSTPSSFRVLENTAPWKGKNIVAAANMSHALVQPDVIAPDVFPHGMDYLVAFFGNGNIQGLIAKGNTWNRVEALNRMDLGLPAN